MAQIDEQYEVIRDYAGQDSNPQFISVTKGEIVRVIKKEIEYYTIEKNSLIGKVPQEYLLPFNGEQSEDQVQAYLAQSNISNQENKSLISGSKHGQETKVPDNISDATYSCHSKQSQQSQQSHHSKYKQNIETNSPEDLTNPFYTDHSHKSLQSFSSIQSVISVNTSASSWHNLLFETPTYEDFDIMKKLSGGAMGKTFLVLLKLTGKQYVMKRVDYLEDNDKKRADQEAEIMQKLSSRYTVRLIWAFVDRFELYMITDYCELGDLKKVIKDLQLLPEEERLNRVWALFAQIIKAVDFMHSKGIIHRDIKPANIFIMEDGTARLGDFGLAKDISVEGFATVAGTKKYQAAEVWLTGKMTLSSDVFAVGVCIYELITGQYPFSASSDQEMIEKIKNGDYEPLPFGVFNELNEKITAMLNPDYNKRPSTQIIIEIEQIKKNIIIFEETQNQKDLERNKKFQQTQLLEIQPVTIQQLNEIKEEIKLLKVKPSSQNIFEKFAEALRAIRSVQTVEQAEISEEMNSITKEIINDVVLITRQNIVEEKYTYQSITTGFACELVNLISRTPIDETKQEMIEIIEIIIQKGTPKHIQKMFYMNTIISLAPFLKNNNRQLQKMILQIFLNIIRNGWKRIKQSQLLQLSNIEENDQQQQNKPKFSLNNSNLSQKSNSQLSQHSNSSQHSQSSIHFQQQSFLNISGRKNTHNIFGDLQISSQETISHIQKLLLFQHPYQTILERQNVIQFLVQEILLDNEYNIENKEKVCEILDILYINGFKLKGEFVPKIISWFCELIKSKDKNLRNHALKALTYFAVNKKNNQTILDEDMIDMISQEFKSINEQNNLEIIRNSLIILQYLYINGSQKTKLEINKIVTSELIEQLKNNQYYGSEAKIIKSAFLDEITYEQLMKIRRSINNKNEEYLDELFNAGLTIVLNEEIVKIMIQEDNKEGLLIILEQIQHIISQNTIETYRLTFNESDFINQQLYNLNSLKVSEIKLEQLDILLLISEKLSPIQNQRLFSKEMIQTIIRIFNSEDKDIINKANLIISNFIEKGMNELKQGEQHPIRQQLMTNEILMNINSLLKDKNKKDIHYIVAQIIANLYKAYPLPPEIEIKVIQELQNKKDQNKLALLYEYPENKQIILENGIENKIFEFIKKTFDYFHLTLKYVKYQTIENRMKFALYAQQEVMKLTNIQYLNEFGKGQRWFDNEKQIIQIERQQLLIIIKEIVNNDIPNYLNSNYPLNLKRIQTINKFIDYIIETNKTNTEIFNYFAKTLNALESLTLQEQQYEQASDKVKIICKDIIRKIILIINFLTIKNEKDIELIFQSGLIIKLFELIKNTPIEQLTQEIIESIKIICFYGSAKHTHQLFQKGIFQIISPKLKNNDNDIQEQILLTFTYIIQKGSQLLQQSEYSSSSQYHLQQLLTHPLPYFDQLEEQQIIITIIQDVILNDESDIKNKKYACELLDILNPEGIKLPINLKDQIIKMFCEQSKSEEDDNRKYSLESLSLIALNQENHELIIVENGIKTTTEYLKKGSDGEYIDSETIKYSLYLIINLFLFGSQQTQQLIQSLISKETLNKIKDNDEAKQIMSAYKYPDQLKEIMKIGRIFQNRSKEGKIQLIKAGLLQMINEMIEKAISKEDGEGEIIAINQNIILQLIHNQYIEEIIYELTDFFNQYLHIINYLPLNQMKTGYLQPLYYLSKQIQIEQKNKLFEMEIIQQLLKFIDSKEINVRLYIIQIILIIIKAGLDGLKLGQQHPLHQQLQIDGTIPKLIQIFKDDEKNENILRYYAQTLSYLFKSLPLPAEIRNSVIEELKLNNDFEELSIIAECPDNHDTILSNQFQMKLFSNNKFNLEYLNISLQILKYGSNINKFKVALAVNIKVEKLTNDEYTIYPIEQTLNHINEKQLEIQSKAEDLLPIIISIINDKIDISLISQLVTEIQDSQDNNYKQNLICRILNQIKLQINGLKLGQQHPLHKQFQSDGTIQKLIQIFKDEKDKDIQNDIAQTLSYLFKSLPLPPEIRNNVIGKLKQYYSPDFDELSILAECPDNHDAILANQFEKKLFQNDKYILEYLNISLSILKYGSNINQLKVASVIKDKIEQLTNDEYIDELGNYYGWNKDRKQEIKSKSKELLSLIISIINDKNNINLISLLVIKTQDSKDNNVRNESINLILNYIKIQNNGLKLGQQHPLHKQLQIDGTIPKLIQIFKDDEKNENILRYYAQTLSYLFKSLPLPAEIRNSVIEELKLNNDFEELSIIAECPDNHDAILSNQFEMKFFKYEYQTLEYLNFSLSILKYGSNINQLKIALAVKDKIEQLTNNEYVNELGNKWYYDWDEDKKQQIKLKAKELIPLIISIIGDQEKMMMSQKM